MKPSFVCCRKPILQTKMQHKGSSSCTLLLQAHTTEEGATQMWQLMRIAVASPHNTGKCNTKEAAHANCHCKPTQHRKMQRECGSSCELPLQAHTTQEGATQMWQLMHVAVASPYDRGGCNKKVAAHANCRCKPTQHRLVQRKCGNSCTLLSQAHTTEEGATKRWQLVRKGVKPPSHLFPLLAHVQRKVHVSYALELLGRGCV